MTALVSALLELVAQSDFTGTVTQLLGRLCAQVPELARHVEGWPKNARALAAHLRRAAPDLLGLGVRVGFEREPDQHRRRIIHLTRLNRSSEAGPATPEVDLLDNLRKLQIDLSVERGELRYRGPVRALTPAVIRAIRDHQTALVQRLQAHDDAVSRQVTVVTALRDSFARLDVLHRDGLLAALRRIRTVPSWQAALGHHAAVLDDAIRRFVAGLGASDTELRSAMAAYEALCRQALEALARYDRRPAFALGCPRCRGPAVTRYRDGPLCDRCRGLS